MYSLTPSSSGPYLFAVGFFPSFFPIQTIVVLQGLLWFQSHCKAFPDCSSSQSSPFRILQIFNRCIVTNECTYMHEAQFFRMDKISFNVWAAFG